MALLWFFSFKLISRKFTRCNTRNLIEILIFIITLYYCNNDLFLQYNFDVPRQLGEKSTFHALNTAGRRNDISRTLN